MTDCGMDNSYGSHSLLCQAYGIRCSWRCFHLLHYRLCIPFTAPARPRSSCARSSPSLSFYYVVSKFSSDSSLASRSQNDSLLFQDMLHSSTFRQLGRKLLPLVLSRFPTWSQLHSLFCSFPPEVSHHDIISTLPKRALLCHFSSNACHFNYLVERLTLSFAYFSVLINQYFYFWGVFILFRSTKDEK